MSDQNRAEAAEPAEPSEWQQRITGEWFGLPAVFDADGAHTGFNKVSRSSVFEDGTTTYYMDCNFMNTGPLRNRFEASRFAFGVNDTGSHRIYLGPDFYGAGHPYGALVDSHYYSPAWRAGLNTVNQILPDDTTQVYSSLLYEGPTIVAVFNGVYRKAFDYDTNPETKAAVDAFLEREKKMSSRPHVLPDRTAGTWAGTCDVFGADRRQEGTAPVEIRHRPVDLVRAEQTWTMGGELDRSFAYARTRIGNRHTYDGGDLHGNAIAYGRALYTTQYHCADPVRIEGREFFIDDDYTMAVAWKLYEGGVLTRIVFGPLTWNPD